MTAFFPNVSIPEDVEKRRDDVKLNKDTVYSTSEIQYQGCISLLINTCDY